MYALAAAEVKEICYVANALGTIANFADTVEVGVNADDPGGSDLRKPRD